MDTPKLNEFTHWLRELLAEIHTITGPKACGAISATDLAVTCSIERGHRGPHSGIQGGYPYYFTVERGPSQSLKAGDRLTIPFDPIVNPISAFFDNKGNLTDRDGKIICPSYDPQSPAMKAAIAEGAQRLSDHIDANAVKQFYNNMQPGVMASAMGGDGDCEQPKHAAEYYADGFENDQRKREREIREAFEEGHNEGLKVGKIDASRKYLARIEELSAEVSVSNGLLRDRQKVLDAIPECVAHGSCVPHALDWIDSAKKRHLTDEATIKNQAATIDRLQQRVRALED
jgi:hypothetical protein